MMNIKPLTEITYRQWLPLWQGYLDFYQSTLSDEVKQNTWAKLTDPNQSHISGFVACIDEDVVGLVHVIEHDSCWTIKPYAYLQDLFTLSSHRNQGVARALIEHVYFIAEQRQCDRVIWLTQQSNHTAQALYDQVATKTGFIQYRKSL